MTVPFERTLRASGRESRWVGRCVLGLALGLIGLWYWWLTTAVIQVRVGSRSARVEASAASHPVQSRVRGRVVELHVLLGAEVRAGEVLVRLDSSQERLQLSQAVAEIEALKLEIVAIDNQIEVVSEGLGAEQVATGAYLKEAYLLNEEAQMIAVRAETLQARTERLGREGVIAQLDVLQKVGESDRQRYRALAQAGAAERVGADRNVLEVGRRERLAELRRDKAVGEGRKLTLVAGLAGLRLALAEREIRAPITGRVGQVSALTLGVVVEPGVTLAVLVPPGDLHVVAEFSPAQALGALRSGQQARLQLEAYPATGFQGIQAEVQHVAQEVRDGTIRVELSIADAVSEGWVLEHGMPGRVQVATKQKSPAELLWQAAGRVIVSAGSPN